nr:HPr family phosphocarrier protein [uncultured Caproiciproducens sp.]
MVSQKVVVRLKFGLHARPAGVLAKLAQQYKCDVKMKVKDQTFNVKSIMGVIAAGVQSGTEIDVICSGEDEAKAVQDIVKAILAGLGE